MSGEAGLGVFNIIWISTEVLNQNINPIIFHARLVRPPLKKACCNRTGPFALPEDGYEAT